MQKAEGADAGAQKHKIVRNAGIAIVAIGVLAGGLIWLEHSKDSGAEPADAAGEVEASAPRIGVSIGNAPKPAAAASAPAAVESAPLSPELAAEVQNAPDTASAALGHSSSSKAPAPAAAPRSTATVPEGTMDPSVKPILAAAEKPVQPAAAAHSSSSSSAARAVAEPAKAPAAVIAPMPAAGKPAFVVQMGVFNSVGNAEDLLAKLKVAGIPAQLETRVQVGPFATRAEALRAQEKLRALGLGKGMLVPPKKP